MTASYGWYGDDFTGATDTLATIAQRGRKAFLFLGVPSPERIAQMPDLDAIGIAGAARSMTPEDMRHELAPVAAFFRGVGVRLLHYKCCSTFDSSVSTGNLATAIATLRGFADDGPVAIVGGQPSLGRYCAFSNLFATADDAVYRLDRHPTMSRHPATPMAEADLRRHFTHMGQGACGAIHWPDIDRGAVCSLWTGASLEAVVFDVLTKDHVDRIGECLRDASLRKRILAVGPSSVAEGFFDGPLSGAAPAAAHGPVLAFSGSLSEKTRRQIDAARSYVHIEAAPDTIEDPVASARIVAKAADLLRRGANVLIGSATSASHARPQLAERSGKLVDAVLRHAPVNRLALSGGDTSSRIVMALGLWGLSFHSRAADGVTVCRTRSDDPARDGMTVLLKGGQMGDEGLFDRFAA